MILKEEWVKRRCDSEEDEEDEDAVPEIPAGGGD